MLKHYSEGKHISQFILFQEYNFVTDKTPNSGVHITQTAGYGSAKVTVDVEFELVEKDEDTAHCKTAVKKRMETKFM